MDRVLDPNDGGHSLFTTVRIVCRDGGPTLTSEAGILVDLPPGEYSGDGMGAAAYAQMFAESGMLGYYDHKEIPAN